ncbi:MAG: LPS export ABC transporter periplasmic protein LptC [Succinivibrio sp.]|nr:LPS export ABC transporter periplasmic protein LptC [Succinivibrio sp.]MCI7773017.1 LPS export ABC transporter periplasmic protein LptC [Succinivibrio sp.]MCI7784141.1 LPS export ABC transporter periplasmic protein LptC [Succinivibrio sp.]MDY5188705.1 LPS export ABC transporter periplasmic protein LptC [Succinivibrio sp.]MDY5324724.1 LPS export ABC transporter periplasmic protein LptC [Succinivibrio sp.]
MNVTKKSLWLAFIFLVLSLLIYIYAKSLVQPTMVDKSSLPTFIATDTDMTIYNLEGKIDKTMVATKTTYYDSKNQYFFDNPLISRYLYDKSNINLWHLKGNKGELIVNKSAAIFGNIILYPGFDDATLQKVEALELFYDFKDNLVTSDKLVTIYGKGFKTQGTVFSADLNTNVIKYKGQPNAIFYPKVK